MTGYVERGEVPGIITLVSQHGKAHVDAVGNKSFDGPEPVARDTIFRIASMQPHLIGICVGQVPIKPSSEE